MKAMDNLQTVLEYLPPGIRQSIRRLPEERLAHLHEIRLRSSRPVGLYFDREVFLTAQGTTTDDPAQALAAGTEDVARAFQAVCAYSVYSHEQELAEGFVTIRGGCRVGICGSAVRQEDRVQALRYISGLSFRIAGEYPGIARSVWSQIGQTASILVAGPVGSGKTTFLRDLCRLLGNSRRTSLVDERGELAAVVRGVPQNDVGAMTDVLDGYPRAAGILTALRVMTPDCIVCDEIGTPEDAAAILQAAGCGVQLCASCHAVSIEELRRRPVMQDLLQAEVFRYCVLLEGMGHVRTVRRLAAV